MHGFACRVQQSCVTLFAYRVPYIACRVLREQRFLVDDRVLLAAFRLMRVACRVLWFTFSVWSVAEGK